VLTVCPHPGNGNCLTAPTNADGAPVVITDCGSNSTALNSWVVASGSGAVTTLQVFGDKCLDVPNGNDANGQKLQIWTCAAGNTNQMWIPQPGNGITWSGKDKCVDLTDGNLTDGNQIQIWDCDQTESNPNQKWNADAVTLPTSYVPFSFATSRFSPSRLAGSSSRSRRTPRSALRRLPLRRAHRSWLSLAPPAPRPRPGATPTTTATSRSSATSASLSPES
ncbi:ricin B lectin domain-containing protein, partial [Mycena epipterygia]